MSKRELGGAAVPLRAESPVPFSPSFDRPEMLFFARRILAHLSESPTTAMRANARGAAIRSTRFHFESDYHMPK